MKSYEIEPNDSGITWVWREREKCRLCGSPALEQRVELPPMCIATTNFHYDKLKIAEEHYKAPLPLPLHVCGSCGLLQIPVVGNPEIQYPAYAYRTSFSLGLPQHFIDTAGVIVNKLGLRPGDKVVEFGSNDGTYLQAFQRHGLEARGIDPAQEIASEATANGVPTEADFFNVAVAERTKEAFGVAKLLVANNVIANIDDLQETFGAARALIGEEGVFLFETQYGKDVIDHFLLDTIYHEHLTYFNISPLTRVLERFGLEVFDVEHLPTKGGSIRVFVQTKDGRHAVSPAVASYVESESRDGIETQARFDRFMEEVARRRDKVHRLIEDARNAGGRIAGYGASIGSSALIGQLNLENDIEFVVDDDTDKPTYLIGPDYEVPIKATSALNEEGVILTVIFAWRYAKPILQRNSAYLECGGKFLVPLPEPRMLP